MAAGLLLERLDDRGTESRDIQRIDERAAGSREPHPPELGRGDATRIALGSGAREHGDGFVPGAEPEQGLAERQEPHSRKAAAATRAGTTERSHGQVAGE
jgi:hypothetical protein